MPTTVTAPRQFCGALMSLFDESLATSLHDALEVVENILESSIEHSVVGKDSEDNLVLWNETARRICSYERASSWNPGGEMLP